LRELRACRTHSRLPTPADWPEPAMGNALTSCTKCFLEEVEFFQEGPHFLAPSSGPYFRLRVDWNPIRASEAARVCPFSLTDEVVVEALDLCGPRGWQPLQWRHERYKQEKAKSSKWSPDDSTSGASKMPEGSRFRIPKRFARARIEKQWYLMQVALAVEDRTMTNVKADIIDSRDAAIFAQRFNHHLRQKMAESGEIQIGVDHDSVPSVQICAPIGCCVLETALPQMAGSVHGEVVTLTPYPSHEVTKFVFDGTEEFLELPQAFFHYVAWATGGREMVYDLQGVEYEEAKVLLVDPCVLRMQRPGVRDLLAPMVQHRDMSRNSRSSEISYPYDTDALQERFDQLHRQCGPLCKIFDPDCRGPRGRKVCGMDVQCKISQE